MSTQTVQQAEAVREALRQQGVYFSIESCAAIARAVMNAGGTFDAPSAPAQPGQGAEVPDVSDLLVIAVECGLIRMSQVMSTDLQDALSAFAQRIAASPSAPAQESPAAAVDEREALVEERTPMDAFENAIRRVGIVSACEWFGHAPDSEFTQDTKRILAARAAKGE